MVFLASFGLGRPVEAAGKYREWGAMAERFLLPLTYPEFDPNDFGETPEEKDKNLLERYRPRVYIAPGGLRPVNFYKDYLPHCVVKDARNGGRVVEADPTRKYLKEIERTHGLYLDYTGPANIKDAAPVAYGRVYKELVTLPKANGGGDISIPFTFLKYNFAFTYSGLPARLSLIKEILAKAAGDPEKWHELDIHGSIIVALANKAGELLPVALILGQHNHFRTYLLPISGDDGGERETWRPSISFALRSNEPYPTPSGPQPVAYRAVGNPSEFSFIITGKGFALFSGYDVVYGPKSGARRLEGYSIELLPYKDPLFVSWISLGAKLRLFGLFNTFYRDGPPGIDLNTWPELSKYGQIMKFWYIKDGDEQAAKLFARHMENFMAPALEPIMDYNSRCFSEDFFRVNPGFADAERVAAPAAGKHDN